MNKKDVKKFEFNIPNRFLYTIIAIVIVLLAAFGVYATVDKTNAWHSINQIEQPTNCGTNSYLQWSGNTWKCATPSPTTCPTIQCTWEGWSSDTCSEGDVVYGGPFSGTPSDTSCPEGAYSVIQDECTSGTLGGTRYYCCVPYADTQYAPGCTDTCSSLGYTCGIRTICGVSVSCGRCSR